MVHAATMSYALNQLEKQGLVRRRANPDDRRGVVIELTPRARILVDAAERELTEIGWGLQDLDDNDAATVAVLLSPLPAQTASDGKGNV
jgi:DNA-binding MarR family transcriptional regulator